MRSAMNKGEFRKLIKEQDAALSESEKLATDKKIFQNLLLLDILKCKTVFTYISFGKEVETKDIIKLLLESGKRVCVPICRGNGLMEAKQISSEDELIRGMYGIYEPPESSLTVKPSELELIIAPGLAFGEDCTRLGRGAGYYDRFIEKAENAKVIALCREKNVFKTVPCDTHDRAVDVIVTEKRIIKK